METIVDEVRVWFAERGRAKFTWLVADSSTPPDLRERLLGLGAQPDADEPVYAGMVLLLYNVHPAIRFGEQLLCVPAILGVVSRANAQ